MKTLRILIPVLLIPVFVSAMFADAMQQDSVVSRTLQISSLNDDLDLLCEKTKLSVALSGPPNLAGLFLAHQNTILHERAFTASARFLLPFFLRAPPLS
ncbi:MAG TPA: hypothetical protein VFG28_05110 [Syntrophales bacterium]|nr:hypothetical protein [Syntrophales bacterium]